MKQTNLLAYNNYPFSPGGNAFKRGLWYCAGHIFIKSGLVPVGPFYVFLLRLFGAKIGKKVTIKPGVNIKYPWFLTVGDYTWIGENVWIDNLVMVNIGANVCLSQGAVLLTGSHNYKKTTFDLITGNIILEDGVWIGAGATVCQGITAATHSVLTVGSVATAAMEPYSVYQGNPARKVRERELND